MNRLLPMCSLILTLLYAGQSVGKETSEQSVNLAEWPSESTCGPVAAYVALRSLGVDARIEDIASECSWDPATGVSLNELSTYINSIPNVTCAGVSLDCDQLPEYVNSKRHAVILVTAGKRDRIGHVVCATEISGEELILVDFPALHRKIKLSEVCDLWDGQVLLVSQDMPFASASLLVPGFSLIALSAGLAWMLRDRSKVSSREEPAKGL